ncbi:MAG: 4Fe-4S binding protein [Planctomycetes bacterium]|nr:4Fe-4S binding protein [Planctomycetota bacterium]
MIKKTVHLHFPPEQARDAIIYRLVKEFDLVVNILQARIEPNEHGRALIELTGTRNDIQKGLQYLKGQHIEIDALSHEIRKNEDRCVHCGACVGVCPSGALAVDQDFQIVFNREQCVLCQACILACSFDAMEHSA